MVLQHLWNATVLYKEDSMLAASAYDRDLANFFQTVEALKMCIRDSSGNPYSYVHGTY